MSVSCGKCHGTHPSASGVRDCYGVGYGGEPITPAPAPKRVSPARTGGPHNVPTPKQVSLILSLAGEREVPVAGRSPEEANLVERLFDIQGWGGVDFDSERDKFVSYAEGRAVIDWLFSLPHKASKGQAPQGNQDEVPAGRYALTGKDGAVRFYQVDRPTEGRWAGYVFVKLLIGSPGDWRKERLNRAVAPQILSAIAADVQGALALFGRKTETCGACHSPLSTPQSRAAGYGKICADKHGFWYPSEAEARAILNEMAGADAK